VEFLGLVEPAAAGQVLLAMPLEAHSRRWIPLRLAKLS